MSGQAADPVLSETGIQKPGLFERLRSRLGFPVGSAREELVDTLKGAASGSAFSDQEKTLLENVLALHELRVIDVMVPRADVIAVEMQTSLFELLSVFRTAGHSRLPVYASTLDDPRGMIHIRDFVDFVARLAESARLPMFRGLRSQTDDADRKEKNEPFDLSTPLSQTKLVRPVLFAPPSMPALDLLVKMQANRTHMALVIDEYGGTDGLVSIEDIVEKIVGDIEDEHDQDDSPQIESVSDGSYLIDARASLKDMPGPYVQEISELVDMDEIDTVSGLIAKYTGRVPVRGEIIKISDNMEFEVLDADPRRVKRVRARTSLK